MKEYEVKSIRVESARSAVLLRLLTSIREYLEYGVNGLAGSKEVFEFTFAERAPVQLANAASHTKLRLLQYINVFSRLFSVSAPCETPLFS